MSYCQHDVHCPGYGPAHDAAAPSLGAYASRMVDTTHAAPLSNAKRKRLERAERKSARRSHG